MLTTDLERYALDGRVPAAALRPGTVDEVCQALAAAHDQGLAVVAWGGGTHQRQGNRLARYDVALDMTGLAGVIDHQPADLTITLQAGMTLAAADAFLAPYGQTLLLETEDPTRATIGGILSAAVAGPLRLSAGTPRDRVLWVEAVQADGTLVHGGARVVKNVAGYDTPKLFVGSHGSLGVITAAAFRLAARPAAAPTLLAGFAHPAAAEGLLAALADGRLAPSLVTLVHGPNAWGTPFDAAPWVLAIGADGPAAATSWQMTGFEALAREWGATHLQRLAGAESAQVRQALMARRGSGTLGLKAMVRPSQVTGLLAGASESGGPVRAFSEVGNGVVYLEWDTPPATWTAIAEQAVALGGGWSITHGPADLHESGVDAWGPARGDRALMRRLKSALDPRGVLSPGRSAGG
jgi:glycolate oxidase FAD binding subunit